MAQLHKQYPQDIERLDVRVMRTGGQLDVSAAVQLQLPTTGQIPRANLQLRVRQPVQGTWQDRGWVMLYFSHFDSVGVATRTLRKDEPIALEDIRYAWLETTRFRGNPLTPAVIRRLEAKGELYADRHLKEERTLRANDVRHAFDVRLGQSVIMTYERDLFVLELTCKSRTQGFSGDEIKLFSPSTNRTYRAQIIGPGKAKWLETLD